MNLTDIDITAILIYFPEDGSIKVHQSRVSPCPVGFPAGYYWYGGKKQGPSRPPKWLERVLQSQGVEFDTAKQTDSKSDGSEEQDAQSSNDVNVSVEDVVQSDNSNMTMEPEVTQPHVTVKRKTRTREIRPPARFRDQLRDADN